MQKTVMNCSRLLNRYRNEKQKQLDLQTKDREIFVWSYWERLKMGLSITSMKNPSPKIKYFAKPTIKTLFTDKTLKGERVKRVDERELVEIFSRNFGNFVQNLGIDGLTNISSYNDTLTVRKVIEKFISS